MGVSLAAEMNRTIKWICIVVLSTGNLILSGSSGAAAASLAGESYLVREIDPLLGAPIDRLVFSANGAFQSTFWCSEPGTFSEEVLSRLVDREGAPCRRPGGSHTMSS